jgi:hypothetical protein
LVDTVTDKRRHFMASFDPDTCPFGCAKESPSRAAERVLAWELIAAHYAKYLLEDIVYLDVDAAMAKTAAAIYNDDPAHKAAMQVELMLMRLPMGMNFEKGVKQLYTKLEEVEVMNVLVITGVPEDQAENRKKELLYYYLQLNSWRHQGLPQLSVQLRFNVRPVRDLSTRPRRATGNQCRQGPRHCSPRRCW